MIRRVGPPALRLLVLGALLVVYALVLSGRAGAQDRAPGGTSSAYYQRQLVALVARVTFNEAGPSEPDLAMIWNITRARGETARERYVWLASHSPCVSGRLTQDEAYQRPGRCRWTRNLEPDGRRPRGWDRERDGPWSATRARWLEHIERVVEYVSGRRRLILCPITPVSWDGARWRDELPARGFAILDCKGELRNVGVVRAGSDEATRVLGTRTVADAGGGGRS